MTLIALWCFIGLNLITSVLNEITRRKLKKLIAEYTKKLDEFRGK